MKRKNGSLCIVSFALFGIASVSYAGPYSVADFLARVDSAYAVKEVEAAAAGMVRKADAVGGLPDTIFGYELMDAPDPEMLAHKFSLKQELPLWGKPGLRSRAAATEAKVAAIMIADRKLEIKISLLKSLTEYHYALGIKRIGEAEYDSLRRLVETAKVKYTTNATTFSALTRAEIELAQTESMIIAMAAMADDARNEAYDMVDVGTEEVPIQAFIPYAATQVSSLNAETLYAKAIGHYPSLAAAAVDIESAERTKALAKSELRPDLMIEFSYTYQPNAQSPGRVSAGFGLNLPIFSAKAKNAEIEMASRRSEESGYRLAGTRDTLYRSIRKTLIQAKDYERRSAILLTGILPLRANDLENLLSMYAVDKAEFEMVLEAVRMRYETEIAYMENERALMLALLDIEYLTGEKLVAFKDGKTE